MRIAIPVVAGKLAMHFGHCEQFVFIDVDPETQQVLNKGFIQAPEHQPGLLPGWLKDKDVNTVIAGGMGARAQNLFTMHGIEVITGVQCDEVDTIVHDYLSGTLQTGENICDH